MIAAIDSYYMHIAQQMQTLTAQVVVNGQSVVQPMGGIVEASDWPNSPTQEGALYLLVMNMVPTGEGVNAQVEYEYFLQWSWLLIGADLTATQQGQNRQDRYRAFMQVIANLRQANYPRYCQKKNYTADAQGNLVATAVESAFPVSPRETVRWGNLRFMPRNDSNASGVLYGVATVELYAYDDVSILVA